MDKSRTRTIFSHIVVWIGALAAIAWAGSFWVTFLLDDEVNAGYWTRHPEFLLLGVYLIVLLLMALYLCTVAFCETYLHRGIDVAPWREMTRRMISIFTFGITVPWLLACLFCVLLGTVMSVVLLFLFGFLLITDSPAEILSDLDIGMLSAPALLCLSLVSACIPSAVLTICRRVGRWRTW